MKLDDWYSPIKTNILMLPELPHVSMAYRMLYQEQKHKEMTRLNTAPPSESLAFAANKRQFYDYSSTTNHFYKPPVQDSRNRTYVGLKRHSLFFCDHCKIFGHSTKRCFKLIGYPSRFKHKRFVGGAQEGDCKSDISALGLTSTQLDNLMAFLSKHKESVSDAPMDLDVVPSTANLAGTFCFFSKVHDSRWIIDNGTTDHMCHFLDLSVPVHPIVGPKHSITIPDGRKVLVVLCGDNPLMNGILLRKVLYLLDFQFNLISVPKPVP